MKDNAETGPRGQVYVGCSGWAYPSWKPDFYPEKTPAKKFLEYYATKLNSVEVNYTFRAMPSRSTVQGWLTQTVKDFCFSFKAPQRITHIKRLQDCGPSLEILAGALEPAASAGKQGLVLFQLPPNLKADEGRLAQFLADASGFGLRMAFEFRHVSWFDSAIYSLLERHGAALCVAESDDLETPDVVTGSFSCYRLRKSDYSEAEVAQITDRLRERASRGDVFAYFKHEETPKGALDAVAVLSSLRERAS